MLVIIETATRGITHCPAPLGDDGNVLLPTGAAFEAVELSDTDAALIGKTNARYSVDAAGRLVVVEVAVVPAPPTQADQVVALKAQVDKLTAALVAKGTITAASLVITKPVA